VSESVSTSPLVSYSEVTEIPFQPIGIVVCRFAMYKKAPDS